MMAATVSVRFLDSGAQQQLLAELASLISY